MAGQYAPLHSANQQPTHATYAMKKHYKADNNVRPTAPLHNLKLQIERLEWWIKNTRELENFDKKILNNTIHELKSVLTQLNNPSKAFTIWTHPDKVTPCYKFDNTYPSMKRMVNRKYEIQ